MDLVELERRMATVLPGGWRMGQIQAEQPSTTYGEFKKEILNEIARCLNMPFNVAAGNSSGYNYASGRLDHQIYYKSIRVDQDPIGPGGSGPRAAGLARRGDAGERLLPRWMRAAAFPTCGTSGSGTARNTSIRPRRPTPRRRGWPATPRTWPTSSPSRAATGRPKCGSGPRRSPLMVQLGLTPTPTSPQATTSPLGQTNNAPEPEE